MKIKTAQCPSCGAKLQIDLEKDIAYCEHCGNNFFLEKKQPPPAHTFYQKDTSPPIYDSGYQGRIRAGIVITVIFVFAITMFILVRHSFSSDFDTGYDVQMEAVEEPVSFSPPTSPAIQAMVAEAFGKPVADISEAEFSKIRYLAIDWDHAGTFFSYSFSEEPFETEAFQSTIQTFFHNDREIEAKDLHCFTGLTALDIRGSSLSSTSFSLYVMEDLKYFWCNWSVSSFYHYLYDPQQIELLHMNLDSEEDVTALYDFSNLRILEFNYRLDDTNMLSELGEMEALKSVSVSSDLSDISFLSGWTKIKELSLYRCGDIMDYSPISNLTELESLVFLRADNMKSLSFLAPLSNLQALQIDNSSIQSLNGLENKEKLKRLALIYNQKLTDASAMLSLSGLEELRVKGLCYWVTDDFSLRELENLRTVSCSGSYVSMIKENKELQRLSLTVSPDFDCTELSGLTGLETLHIESGFIKKLSALTRLSSLKEIVLVETSLSNSENYFLFQIPALTSLDMTNTSMTFDVKNIRIDSPLEKLRIQNGARWTITDGGNAASFNAFAELLSTLTELEELTLTECDLTETSFFTSPSKLRILDISNNYFTDLSALLELMELEYVDYRQNPLVEQPDFPDTVEVAK